MFKMKKSIAGQIETYKRNDKVQQEIAERKRKIELNKVNSEFMGMFSNF